jgi:MoaA/NifB/PqqE/SkfB family radical SAM enzyme
MGIRYSVGVVGFKEAITEIEFLRRELSPDVYLWINAYKREINYYHTSDIEKLTQTDPFFEFNLHHYQSLGKACKTGETVFSVDGNGVMYRCHFIKTPIGNIYDNNFENNLYRRSCTNQTCSCHIGYIHMDDLELYPVYGEGILERIPKTYIK